LDIHQKINISRFEGMNNRFWAVLGDFGGCQVTFHVWKTLATRTRREHGLHVVVASLGVAHHDYPGTGCRGLRMF
jgi:hypothetical protein